MALSTYTELQAAILDHIGSRADVTAATSRDLIALAEARVRRRLTVRPMVGRSTATISDPYEEVPSDFAGPISLVLTDQTPRVHLEWVTPERLNELKQDNYTSTGVPRYYSTVGGEFGFAPEPGGDYAAELIYYKELTPLSDSATSNWLLDSHPDIYLNGALAEAGKYLVDDPRFPLWKADFNQGLEELTQASVAETFGGRLSVGENRVA